MDLVILAAGRGTRMESNLPKVLHGLRGKSLIEHSLSTAEPLKFEKTIVVVGYGAEKVRSTLGNGGLEFVLQKRQLGTGHALLQARKEASGSSLLVVPGDVPLVRKHTLKGFINFFRAEKPAASVLTVQVEDPQGYGRIIREEGEGIARIVEQKDADINERQIDEINTGIFALRNDSSLWKGLNSLDMDNAQGEIYLTDLIALYKGEGRKVLGWKGGDEEEFLGVNTRKDLAQAHSVLNRRKIDDLLDSGVTITDPSNTYVDDDVQCGRDTVIRPFSLLEKGSTVGSNCDIGPFARIVNSQLGNGVRLFRSELEDCEVRDRSSIGPFSAYRETKI